jgi:hypothetical protein
VVEVSVERRVPQGPKDHQEPLGARVPVDLKVRRARKVIREILARWDLPALRDSLVSEVRKALKVYRVSLVLRVPWGNPALRVRLVPKGLKDPRGHLATLVLRDPPVPRVYQEKRENEV